MQVRRVSGQGTTFWVVLPVTAIPQTAPAELELDVSSPLLKLNILLVDDEPSIVKALIRLLHRDGHTGTLPATDAKRCTGSRNAPMM